MSIEPDCAVRPTALVWSPLEYACHVRDVHRADRYASVTADQWSRTGRRSDGAGFTVDSLGRYHLHDVEHHLHDVGA